MTQLLRTAFDIKTWLNSQHVTNYTLLENEQYGFVVDVKGDVDLFGKNLIIIPVQFNHINGYFDCGSNQLLNLTGCPLSVDGSFYCSYNSLTSLGFCPLSVGGRFYCHRNTLTSLEYCPQSVSENFDCSNNPLLGDAQNLTKFEDIFRIHQEIVKIKSEKHNLSMTFERTCLPQKNQPHKI